MGDAFVAFFVGVGVGIALGIIIFAVLSAMSINNERTEYNNDKDFKI